MSRHRCRAQRGSQRIAFFLVQSTPDDEQIVLQDYYDDGSGEAKRYYQVTAVNRTIEAITKGANRVLRPAFHKRQMI